MITFNPVNFSKRYPCVAVAGFVKNIFFAYLVKVTAIGEHVHSVRLYTLFLQKIHLHTADLCNLSFGRRQQLKVQKTQFFKTIPSESM